MENKEMVSAKKEAKWKTKLKNIIPSMNLDIYRIVIISFLIFSCVLCCFRTFTIVESVQFPGFTRENINYKLDETVYTSVFLALYVFSLVASFIIGIFSHRVSYSEAKRSNSFIFVSSLVGFCMVGCGGFFAYRNALVDTSIKSLGLWVIILMLFTGVYFAMDAAGFVSDKTRPFFSLGTIAFGIVRVMYEFLECHDKQQLSSNEYHLLSLVFILCFFCCSTRLYIYKKVGFWYKTFGLMASLSLLIYSVPEIYLCLFQPYYVDSKFVFCIVDMVMAFYVGAKLLSVTRDNEGVSNE